MDLLFVLGSCKRLFCFRTSIRFSNPAKCLARSLNATCGFLVVGFLNFDWCNSPDFWNITPSQTNKYCAKHQSEFWCSLLEFGISSRFSSVPSLTLTVSTWKWMLGRRLLTSILRRPISGPLCYRRDCIFTQKKSSVRFSNEPRKKKNHSYFPLYWLFNRDPYNGLWNNLHIIV